MRKSRRPAIERPLRSPRCAARKRGPGRSFTFSLPARRVPCDSVVAMRIRRALGVVALVVGAHAADAEAVQSPVAPGRIVVRFRDSLTDAADAVFARGGRFRGATRDRSDSLDR